MKKKKIAILTLTDNYNLGNRLQNYAVQYYIESHFNVKCETIGYCYNCLRKTKVELFKDNLKYFVKCRLGIFMRRFKIDRSSYLFNKLMHQSKYSFYKGFDKNILLKKYDAFIVGSDQIWNPHLIQSTDINFLTFVPALKKICFSPSIAVDEIPDDIYEDFKKGIMTFDRISIREEIGAELVNQIIGDKRAVSTIDPTLCVEKEQWELLSKQIKKKEGNYIVVYILGNEPFELSSDLKYFVEKYGYEVVYIGIKSNFNPKLFINLINHAKLVCTDSFHGTVFSLIFNKPVIIYTRYDKNVSMNSRLESLTNLFMMQKLKRKNIHNLDDVFQFSYYLSNNILEEQKKRMLIFLTEEFDKKVNN